MTAFMVNTAAIIKGLAGPFMCAETKGAIEMCSRYFKRASEFVLMREVFGEGQ